MSESDLNKPEKHTAGAFDIRTFIAALMVIFGVVIVLAGLFGPARTADSDTAGHTINVVVGIGLILFAAIMQGWAMLRPTIVDEAELSREKAAADKADGGTPGH